MWFFWVIGCIGVVFFFVVGVRRHTRNYDADLWPIIEANNLEFVRSKTPGFFQVGPFPKIEFRVGGKHTEIAGISGEYSVYRIVTLRDSQNREHEVWAKLVFEAFQLKQVEWRPELSSFAVTDNSNSE